MAEKQELNILDLNDDCLTTICKFLKLEDLRSLDKAHSQFGVGIGNALQSKEADIWFVIDTDQSSYRNDENISPFLYKFGDKIRNLEIGTPNKELIKNVIESFFNGGSVRKCIFNGNNRVQITAEFIAANTIFFKSLKSLEIMWSKIDDRSLRALLDAITDSNIETFEIRSLCPFSTDFPLTQFLSTPITKLEIVDLRHVNQDEIDNLPVNTTLKYLELHASPQNIKILHRLKAVETLCLMYKKFFASVIEIENLRVLRLYFDKITQFGIEQFLRGLVRKSTNTLKEFSFDVCSVRLTRVDISEMAKIVRELRNLEELCLPVHFTEYLQDFAVYLKKLRSIRIADSISGHFCSKDDFKSALCLIVAEAKNLEFIQIYAPWETDIDFYNELYDMLVRIRENQGTKHRLWISLRDTEIKFRSRLEAIIIRSEYISMDLKPRN